MTQVVQTSERAANEIVDAIARRELGISGPGFLHRWDTGEYYETTDVDGLSEVIAAIPLIR